MNFNQPFKYRIVIEPCEEGGFSAHSPDLPGCQVQGESYVTTLHEIHAAIEAYVQDCIEAGDELPRPEKKLATI